MHTHTTKIFICTFNTLKMSDKTDNTSLKSTLQTSDALAQTRDLL